MHLFLIMCNLLLTFDLAVKELYRYFRELVVYFVSSDQFIWFICSYSAYSINIRSTEVWTSTNINKASSFLGGGGGFNLVTQHPKWDVSEMNHHIERL